MATLSPRSRWLVQPRTILLLIVSLPIVDATFTIARCCTLAVRQDPSLYSDEHLPWDVCNYHRDLDFSSNITYPSVKVTMGWVREYCRGTQISTTSQWLLPLATYISPYMGILLLCPLGEDMTQQRITGHRSFDAMIHTMRKPIQESLSILGDPASAIFGAYYEVLSDTLALRKLSHKKSQDLTWLQQRASWATALLGGLKFSSTIGWRPEIMGLSLKSSSGATHNHQESSGSSSEGSPSNQLAHGAPQKIDQAINLVITARPSFSSGILIPVVLMLVVNAATLYDAYSKVGDKETALALAYCIWYSWLIVVGMAGNCFASAINHDLARRALGEVITLGDEPVSVALRERYVNNKLWSNWELQGGQAGTLSFTSSRGEGWTFWLRFCVGQFLGWCVVCFASAAATAIAWTTPTTGLGCRSFNFILYAVLAFVAAYLHVLCSWLAARRRQHELDPDRDPVIEKRRIRILFTVRVVYWFVAMCNAAVMILGTAFHLIGVFRACWCDRLSWADGQVIELNSKTDEAVRNAQLYWLSTSYVTFGCMWLACLVALTFRSFIGQRMEDWLRDDEERWMYLAKVL
ncbi:hypothetical protein B0I35DRAFT_407133 [Stachybotrys elegans]|uniref:Uncharacterized protein n=1 Tax=Stachybotrys elegans TaxID=80388 RepID=A0A8K0WSR9_9HYPO|nr:hypothetical protein B0I35DRAFT_407133 [Stachybotrys elegans]